jgi:predicted TIM-barrel fold metal-dependent hydrolase
LEQLESRNYKDLNKKFILQQFIDQAAVFPFQDVFRDKMPEALYRASNLNVSRFTTRFPFSLRLIGYMRCDPLEGKKAVNEVAYGATQLGLRGLKLHPRSEEWIDDINSPRVIEVLMEAAKYSLPVIFDTRGKQSILDIGELVKNARNTIGSKAPELLPHLKVIIAHFAQGNVGDEEVYQTVCQPNVWGDLSMLHGKGAANFFKDFRRWFVANDISRKTNGRNWSEFLLFASDFPYFGAKHAEGLISNVISQEFYESGGTLADTENILGLNQLKLLPEYNVKFVETQPIPAISSVITPLDPNIDSLDVGIKAIARLIDSGIIDIEKLLFQFDGDYDKFKGEVLISTKNKQNQNQEINLIMMNLVPEKLILLSTLSQNSAWKKFGFKYFNPEDRRFFHSVLAQSRPANDENQVFQMIREAYK